MVGSDHAPQDFEKKHNPDIWQAPPGSPALDYWVPLMLDRVARGEITISRLVEVACTTPARRFGLYPAKGILKEGADADIVVIDMAKTTSVDTARFKSKGRYTAFEGWPMRGIPVMTFVNGKLVAKDGQIVGKPGDGEFVRSAR
jgi:dihydroorotase-like cyclic amidohydrolase